MKCFSCIFRRKESDTNAVETEDMQNVRVFTYKELKKYTEDFSWANKIGEGGFGFVYRGKLRDGKLVAIKVLSSESRQGAREFLTELNMISSVEHDNLVKLYGCCIEADNRILVYDYLENNSLAQTLLAGGQSDLQFTWQARMKICIGVARGLAYLHEEVQPHIVHRDIKASNILLDKDLNPKISDFGLAKLIPADMTHVSTRVAGTVGYLAPEYAIRGRLTRKADIYSFGVLLLEIVSGRSNSKLATEDHFLLERSADITHGVILLQTWMLHEQNALLMIVDPNLNGYFNEEEACRLLKVGLLCTQDNPKLRPYMSTIVKMLTGEQDVDQSPITKPGLIEDLTELKIRSQRHQRGSESILSITASSGPDTAMAESSSHAFLSLR